MLRALFFLLSSAQSLKINKDVLNVTWSLSDLEQELHNVTANKSALQSWCAAKICGMTNPLLQLPQCCEFCGLWKCAPKKKKKKTCEGSGDSGDEDEGEGAECHYVHWTRFRENWPRSAADRVETLYADHVPQCRRPQRTYKFVDLSCGDALACGKCYKTEMTEFHECGDNQNPAYPEFCCTGWTHMEWGKGDKICVIDTHTETQMATLVPHPRMQNCPEGYPHPKLLLAFTHYPGDDEHFQRMTADQVCELVVRENWEHWEPNNPMWYEKMIRWERFWDWDPIAFPEKFEDGQCVRRKTDFHMFVNTTLKFPDEQTCMDAVTQEGLEVPEPFDFCDSEFRHSGFWEYCNEWDQQNDENNEVKR